MRQPARPLAIPVAASLLVAILLTACAPAAAPAAPAQSAAPTAATGQPAAPAAPAVAKPTTTTKLVQALPILSLAYLPIFVGIDRGFFRDEGIEMDTRVMGSSAALAGLLNGDVDIAVGGSGVRAAMQGAPLKSFLYSYNATVFELVAGPEIRTIEDLRGKVLGASSPGSTEEISASVMLRQAGLDPARDVTFLMVPAGNQLQTLVAGAVQAMMVNPDISALAQDNGLHVLKGYEEVGRVMPQPFAGYVVTQDSIQKRPEIVRAYIRAYLKALQYIKANPTEAAAIANRAFDLEPRVAQAAVPAFAHAIVLDDIGGATEEGLRLEIDNNLRALQGQANVTGLSDLIDFTQLRQAQREIGVPCKSGYLCR
jgi:NitT/TauT family transport system substrate-binding protein